MILDEPTSSLDEGEVEKLFKVMNMLKKRGTAIVFVTHFWNRSMQSVTGSQYLGMDIL